MVFWNPVVSAWNKERAYFSPTVIKNSGSPWSMLSFSFIRVFIAASTVKFIKPAGIFRKMRRNPVKNNAYTGFMKHIYHTFKIIRSSETWRRSKITGNLIPPRTVKRKFSQRHKFYVSVGHFLHIRNNIACKINISEMFAFLIKLPRTKMNLININRTFIYYFFWFFFHPVFIGPFITAFKNFWCSSRSCFKMICIRIRFKKEFTLFSFYTIFVAWKLF